jgi:hypothetical protein
MHHANGDVGVGRGQTQPRSASQLGDTHHLVRPLYSIIRRLRLIAISVRVTQIMTYLFVIAINLDWRHRCHRNRYRDVHRGWAPAGGVGAKL